MKKKEEGITLVALIITIIILIILAAVTLNGLMGEHGILQNAKTASEEHEESQAREILELAMQDLIIDKKVHKDIYNEAEYIDNYLKEEGMKVEEDKVTVKGWTFEIDRSVPKIVKDLGRREDGSEENTTGETLISKIKENPKAYYGKKVIGYTANEISDWRIFYADDENVFLITTDYITSDKVIACNNTMTKQGKYSVNWSSESIAVASTANVNKFSPVTSETMKWAGDYSRYPNGRFSSTLLDTNKWTAFLDKEDGTGKGKMAIGSPTINMWVASWNEKCPNNKIYCNSSSEYYGYYIGNTSVPYGQSMLTISQASEYQKVESDNMYFPHKIRLNDNDECQGYWIASPISGNNLSCLICVYYNGQISQTWALAERAALRPVVCLNSDVKIISSEDDDVITLK